MQKIIPALWFDNNAEEAVNFYLSLFPDSRVISKVHNWEAGPGPKGTVNTLTFALAGQTFIAINSSSQHRFTPALSFFVNCQTELDLDRLWKALIAEGTILMELARYPFSEKFGWVQDRFGLSWQLNLAGRKQMITPFFMFTGKQYGKAEAAINFYVSQFADSKQIKLEHFGAGEEQPECTVKHAIFMLAGQEFMAIDSGLEHTFTFTPAYSFLVNCETQAELDCLWKSFSEGGKTEQCGWLKDRHGVSWQIIPSVLKEMLNDPDPVKSLRVMNALLQMHKIDIQTLEQAYQEK